MNINGVGVGARYKTCISTLFLIKQELRNLLSLTLSSAPSLFSLLSSLLIIGSGCVEVHSSCISEAYSSDGFAQMLWKYYDIKNMQIL